MQRHAAKYLVCNYQAPCRALYDWVYLCSWRPAGTPRCTCCRRTWAAGRRSRGSGTCRPPAPAGRSTASSWTTNQNHLALKGKKKFNRKKIMTSWFWYAISMSKYCCSRFIDLMHWRHHAAMLGVWAIALYALVICDWHISDNCIYMHNPIDPQGRAPWDYDVICIRSIVSSKEQEWMSSFALYHKWEKTTSFF